jgi:hypothetical protein
MTQKYGMINNIGELKHIQTSMYKGEGFFIGITRNGFGYIYDGKITKKLTREEIGIHLSMNPEQVLQMLRKRDQLSFNSSKERAHDITNAFESVSDESTRVIEKGAAIKESFRNMFSKSKTDTRNETLGGGRTMENMDISVGREMSSDVTSQSNKVASKNQLKDIKHTVQKTVNQAQDLVSDVLSFEESNEDKKSLKKQVRDLTKKVELLEQNMVTKEQMIKIIESLSKGQ